MLENLAKTYDPKDFENRIYNFWNDNGYFKSEVNKDKKPYTIMMPPPNVTGSLHMGHAWDNTLQDILIRWKRMSGYEVLWQAGTDHASISTEAKVVEKLKGEGKLKEEIGREAFLKEAWDWTGIYGSRIKEQLKKVGVSADWSRERFTLDEKLSKAVEEVFIRLYDKGLIYRGDRIINWCPNCKTAISDAEVEHEEVNGNIWNIRYPIKDSDEYIVIATTRPETMLGDLAVAVNPEDERYKHLIGKSLILPLVGREIPIIADNYVEMDFGSGAVKITPSHDINDFDVGERHNLGQCIVIDGDAKIVSGYDKYSGLERYEARRAIIEDLEALGLMDAIKDHKNAIGHCERCRVIVEPLISKQWFVKMKDLAKPALEVYRDKELRFIPDRFGKVYANWLENIRDWCISRQLWWGHRMPVYYCGNCENIMVDRKKPECCSNCSSTKIVQDEDTLDTWFSSALWPFSTLGWPEKTPELDYFFPTDVLVTGYDIIFFWVVRMVFSSIENMGEIPFKDVLIHGLVRDDQGRKMSKSLGNGIDPLEIIENYGADALRVSLILGNSPGNDVRFYIERVEANRNFANKLWNATRFVLMNLDEDIDEEIEIDKLEEEDKWILAKLNQAITETSANLENYELGLAAQRIIDFTWEDYCDWYIEMIKSRLFGEDGESKDAARKTLLYVLKNILKLLHPFIPFITEEIWQHLPGNDKALIVSAWPERQENFEFIDAKNKIEYIQSGIKGIRNARAEMNIVPSKKSLQIFVSDKEEIRDIINMGRRYFVNLAQAEDIEVRDTTENIPSDNVSVVIEDCEIFLPLSELIDFEKEIERLNKEKEHLESEIKRVVGKLSNKSFVDKAPEKVVQEEREKQIKYEGMLEKIVERLASIKK